jgi:hypothetical protein
MFVYKRPLAHPVLDWRALTPDEIVVVVDRQGHHTPASVDTVADQGQIMWLKPLGIGNRTLYLKTDPIMIHRPPQHEALRPRSISEDSGSGQDVTPHCFRCTTRSGNEKV